MNQKITKIRIIGAKVKRYCSAMVDMDTGNVEKLDTEIEYDPFVRQLIGRKVG